MSFRLMSKQELSRLVASAQQEYRVVTPKPIHGQFVFADLESPDDLHLNYSQTVLPPKKYLMPQREELLQFAADGSRMEPVCDAPPTLILGVHTCDLHAIRLLDRVFSKGFADQNYASRRENTLLVGIECLKPCTRHAFCKSMGTLTAPDNFDLLLTDVGDEYSVDIGSEAGEALLERHAQTRPAADDDYKRLNAVLSQKWPQFSYRLDFDVSELPSLMRTSYNSPLWKELGNRCLACGSCTNVCPTCYCFGVTDEVDLALTEGKRVRYWDSCQLDEFATVAGGHNFRVTRAERQRHRFLRKGLYQTDNFGLVGCVGCGRCALACLVNITPVDTFNALYHERAGGTARQQDRSGFQKPDRSAQPAASGGKA